MIARRDIKDRSPRYGAAILATLAVTFAAPAAGAAASEQASASPAAASRQTCSARVTIAGKRTCLAAGRSCQRKYESKYKSKGFTCKRVNGRYRLARMKQEF